MTALITYEGFTLVEQNRGYCSTINGQTITFDSASQWKKYIDLIILRNGKEA